MRGWHEQTNGLLRLRRRGRRERLFDGMRVVWRDYLVFVAPDKVSNNPLLEQIRGSWAGQTFGFVMGEPPCFLRNTVEVRLNGTAYVNYGRHLTMDNGPITYSRRDCFYLLFLANGRGSYEEMVSFSHEPIDRPRAYRNTMKELLRKAMAEIGYSFYHEYSPSVRAAVPEIHVAGVDAHTMADAAGRLDYDPTFVTTRVARDEELFFASFVEACGGQPFWVPGLVTDDDDAEEAIEQEE